MTFYSADNSVVPSSSLNIVLYGQQALPALVLPVAELDMNFDGKLDVLDLALLKRMIMEIE